MIDRREQVLDAAIRVLGTVGSRGLTHRSVDREAGFPMGSTSNYFRSRGALITGIVQHLEELDYRDWAAYTPGTPITTAAKFTDILTQSVVNAVTVDRTRTQARYAIFVEASIAGPDSQIAASIERSRQNLVSWGTEIATTLALPHPRAAALAIVDYVDGLIVHALTRPDVDAADLHARIARFVDGLGSSSAAR